MSRQAWSALADAAKALLAVASAALGEGSVASAAHPPLSLSPCPPLDGLTVDQLVNEFLKAKAKQDRSDRYLRALRVSLGSFAKGRGKHSIGSVTLQALEAWLDRPEWTTGTKHGYLMDVRTLFNFAVRRGYLDRNPALGVELPRAVKGEIGIHTPAQVRHVLALSRERDLNLTRSLAIRYFAGVRSAEADRMSEVDILLDQGRIVIPASKSKTRQRRLITIQPNLRAWLALGGSIPLHDVNNRMRFFTAALAKQGIPWPHNVTRHSFVSYHLARFENAGKTALEAGHSETMLFGHYRALVTPEAAAEFWAIVPGSGNKP